MSDIWLAHEQPERPLVPGAWVCKCDKCSMAITATVASINPDLRLVVKGYRGRTVLTGKGYLDAMSLDGLDVLDESLGGIREVFVQLEA